MRKVLITGITGMDGSYMADYLLAHTDHKVYGLVRRSTKVPEENIAHLRGNPRIEFIEGDLLDYVSLENIIADIKPDYLINFAAQSHVHVSWEQPIYTWQVNTEGVLKLLEAIRKHAPLCRFYQASSSEMFGDVITARQDESHPFRPRSIYGASKCAAHNLVKVYRESYNLYAVAGICFNHEGERRHESFVTRKITKGVARIAKALKEGGPFEPIELGNLDATRDWSHAMDFCDGIWRMLNQEVYRQDLHPELYLEGSYSKYLIQPLRDYILASGGSHSIREFVEKAFKAAEIQGVWWHGLSAKPEGQEYLLSNDGVLATKKYVPLVKINPKFYRPAEVQTLLGDATAARQELGWKPQISFGQLVERMGKHDLGL